MESKITALTAEQESRLVEFRAEYLAHGINTAPADRPRAEAAFARAYQTIGKEPVPVLWVDSPATACLAFHVLKNTGEDSLGRSLRDSLRVSLSNALRDSLGNSLRVSLMESPDSLLRNSLVDSLLDSLRESKIEHYPTYWWGQMELYWIAFYKFCAGLGVHYAADDADKLDIMHEIGLSCGWWYPRDGFIIACERPDICTLDETGRIHSDTGPAVRYRDGRPIYAIHGVRVPEQVVMAPDTLTATQIEAEKNAEVRRVMITRFGADRYMRGGLSATVLDHDERWGTLWRKLRQGDSDMLMLQVVNRSPEPDGSFRHYWLRIHPECRPLPTKAGMSLGEPQELSALNAVASTFGMRGADYAAALIAES